MDTEGKLFFHQSSLHLCLPFTCKCTEFGASKYKNALACIQYILKNEGMSGFYKVSFVITFLWCSMLSLDGVVGLSSGNAASESRGDHV